MIHDKNKVWMTGKGCSSSRIGITDESTLRMDESKIIMPSKFFINANQMLKLKIGHYDSEIYKLMLQKRKIDDNNFVIDRALQLEYIWEDECEMKKNKKLIESLRKKIGIGRQNPSLPFPVTVIEELEDILQSQPYTVGDTLF